MARPPSTPYPLRRGLRRGGAALGLSVLVHLLLLAALPARPGPLPPPPSFPVELVAPPAPAPVPPPRPQQAARPDRHQRGLPAPRRLARSNPSPAPTPPAAGAVAGAELLASPGTPGGEGTGDGPGTAGSFAGPAAAPPARPAAPPAPAGASAPPRALEAPAPAYPLAARRRRAEGLTVVRARVGREGRVLEAVLAESSGADDLDRAALEAVRGWRFQPGTRGPAPVEAWVRVPVRFRLGSAL